MFVCIIISKLAASGAVWEDSVCFVCAKSFGIGGCSIKSFRKVMEDLLQNKSFKTSIPFLSICPTFEPSPYYKTMLAFLFQFLYLSATAGTTRVGMDVGILGGGRRH